MTISQTTTRHLTVVDDARQAAPDAMHTLNTITRLVVRHAVGAPMDEQIPAVVIDRLEELEALAATADDRYDIATRELDAARSTACQAKPCRLKVMGQVENDMILGTSAYKNGIRATTFRPEIDAGIGYLLGAGPVPQVVRTFYLDMAATERVAARARAVREAAGTLSGAALGNDGDGPRDVLADLAAVFGTDAGLQWAEAAARLASRFPQRWDSASPDEVSAQARSLGVASVDVKAAGRALKGCRAADVAAARDAT